MGSKSRLQKHDMDQQDRNMAKTNIMTPAMVVKPPEIYKKFSGAMLSNG